eukprot:g709.t1
MSANTRLRRLSFADEEVQAKAQQQEQEQLKASQAQEQKKVQSSSTSRGEVAMSVAKLVAGVGSYALPRAAAGIGWLGAVVGLPLLASFCFYCLTLLLQCRIRVLGPLPTVLASASRDDGRSGASAGADAEPGADADADADADAGAGAGAGAESCAGLAAPSFADTVRACLGRRAAAPLPFLVFFAAFGACVGYIDFLLALVVGTGDGAQEVPAVDAAAGKRLTVVACAAPVFVLLCWIRSFRWLAWTSVLGDVAFVLAQVTVYTDGLARAGLRAASQGSGGAGGFVALRPFGSGTADFVGAVVFLYGITLFVLPMQAAMRDPRQFSSAVAIAFGVTSMVNLGVALLGYAIWGDGVAAVVIASMAPSWYRAAVKALLVLDMTVSFPIVITPARELVEAIIIPEAASAAAPQSPMNKHTQLSPPALDISLTTRPGAPTLASPRTSTFTTTTSGADTTPEMRKLESSVVPRMGSTSATIRPPAPPSACQCFTGGAIEWRRNFVRTALTLLVLGMALALPAFLGVVSLVSGVSLVTTSLCYPLACFLRVEWHYMGCGTRAVHLLLFAISLVLAVFTTATAVTNLLGSH